MQYSFVSHVARDVLDRFGLVPSRQPRAFASVEYAMRDALYRHEQARVSHAKAVIARDAEEKRLAAISEKRCDLEQRAVAAMAANRLDLATLAARSIAGLEADEAMQRGIVDELRRTASVLHETVEDERRRLVALKQGFTVAQLRRADPLSTFGETAIERAEKALAAITARQSAARFLHEPSEADQAATVLGNAGFGEKRTDPAEAVLARLKTAALAERKTAFPGIASMSGPAS